jgi:hypothetical protein
MASAVRRGRPSPPPGLSLVPRDGWRPLPHGGWVVAEGSRLATGIQLRPRRALTPGPSAASCAGEGWVRAADLPERTRILPSPRGTSGEGSGEGPSRTPARCLSKRPTSRQQKPSPSIGGGSEVTSGRGRPLAPKPAVPRLKFIPSPACGRGCGSQAAGEGPRGRQRDARRRTSTSRHPSTSPSSFGGGGRVMRARRGRLLLAPDRPEHTLKHHRNKTRTSR